MSADAPGEAILTRWAESGLMSLTGEPEGPVDASPAFAYAAFADELGRLVGRLGLPPGDALRDPAIVLAGRARENGFARGGRVSAGGATRLIRGRDGWGALSLARDSDRELVPALLGAELGEREPWLAVAAAARRSVGELVERAAMLGLPAATLGEAGPPAVRTKPIAPAETRSLRGALVVDLSALWAGPLSTALLAAGGARVVKVEFAGRPDGARRGNARFFDWLGHGKLACEISGDADGEALLARLIDAADIVIEASRPRALRQRGLAFDQRRNRAGKIWVRITGHGAEGPAQHRVAFGDDAAVAGGLVGRGAAGDPVFAGDAIADPLTGVRVAGEVVAALDAGGGTLVDVSLSGVAAEYAARAREEAPPHSVERSDGGWRLRFPGGAAVAVADPPRIPVSPPARPVGADTATIRALLDAPEP
ncbi:CoA transferase [Microbacterium soli]|uniref:CoA transferase n=1 Tax=Microbacterium soli TaxID=446075 RepID=A0ABP7NH05_9MICO